MLRLKSSTINVCIELAVTLSDVLSLCLSNQYLVPNSGYSGILYIGVVNMEMTMYKTYNSISFVDTNVLSILRNNVLYSIFAIKQQISKRMNKMEHIFSKPKTAITTSRIFADLRKEFKTILPISGYEITLYEPVVASVQRLRNQYLAIVQDIADKLESLQEGKDEELSLRRQELIKEFRDKQIKFLLDALEQYVLENIKTPVPIDSLAAVEVFTYIPLLLELLAHNWVLRDISVSCPATIKRGKKEKVCGAESTVNIVFNPIYLSKLPDEITTEDEKRFIDDLMKQAKLKSTNLIRLYLKLPTKHIKPKIVTVALNQDGNIKIELEITVSYMTYSAAKKYGFKNLIERPESLPFSEILNIHSLVARKVDTVQNKILLEEKFDTPETIIDIINNLPRSEAETIQEAIKNALEDEPDIEPYIEYTCPVCGNTSKIVFRPVDYFLATITMEAFRLT